MSAQPVSLKQSPLRALHEELGAKLVEFGGWEMPLQYPSGTVAEHMACRRDAVAFDVSHLGTVRIEGKSGFPALQDALTNDLRKIAPGRAQYTHLLDDEGSVLDDIIVWWIEQEAFDVMPNASNTARVRQAIGGEDTTEKRAVIAIQGPRAREKLKHIAPKAAAVGRFHVLEFAFQGAQCLAAGTGYTGEDGVECAVPNVKAEEFFRAVIASGVKPAGLGARDTLRLEAGLPLHGHELGPGITPLQAGLSWVVGWDKEHFRGKEALEKERASGPKRLLRGLLGEGRRPLRAEGACLIGGRQVGQVTSGNFSPVLERGIGLAFLPPDTPDGQPVEVDLRGSKSETRVVKPPFQRLAPNA